MATYNLVTRAQWDARPPTRVVPLVLKNVINYVVHYSGAVRTQTVRSIQNFCMDDKGHSDIDYNYLVRGRNLYVGRGDNVGSHNLNQNSSSIGVCIIGEDGDATNDDFRTVRELYDQFTVRLNRPLNQYGHRETQRPGYTDCPGNQIQSWVDAGMPYPGQHKNGACDMFFLQVHGEQSIYVSNGINTRPMPAGTYETTVKPLVDERWVPWRFYNSLAELLLAGGPLVKETIPGTVPTNITGTFTGKLQ